MDKQLLKALDNLSVSLEMIAAALASKEDSSSATSTALKGGDFGKSLEAINTGIQSIKTDTQEILSNQKTIIALQKEKSKDVIEETGTDKKKESNIKKGVGTILLIAVAVLAIGLAFKLVGAIDFLSVISLALAITLISIAFEKVAKLDLSIKQALIASLTLVLMATAITISSWILSMVSPIGIPQLLTSIFIAVMFAAMSASLENIFIATVIFDKLKVSPLKLILTLVSISTAIMASSWILSLVQPITVAQGITAILISAIFTIIGFNLDKIGLAVTRFDKLKVSPLKLILTLVSISTAIMASSWVLSLINPLSFPQALTAIMISAVFLIISFNFEKIAMGVAAFKKTGVKPQNLLFVLVGIAAAITASSWVLSLVQPIGIWQFVTALGIALLFALMSYIMPELAVGIAIMEKALGKKGLFLMPLIFVAISLAIMLSSHILNQTADIPFMLMFKILVFSIVLTLAVIVLGIAALFLVKVIGTTTIAKGSISIVMLATSIMLASLLLSEGNYTKYPGWEWTLFTAIAIIAFGLIVKIFKMIGVGVSDAVKGGLSILIIAGTIMVTSHILAAGNYKKFPSLDWSLGVAAALAVFGVAALLLGTQALNPFFYAGLVIILLVAVTIVAASYILAAGKYQKYPTLDWNLGVAAALAVFGVSAIVLGIQVLNPFFYAGLGMILLVSKTIVDVSKILSKGKYNLPGFIEWSIGTALLFSTFTPILVVLGAVGLASAVMSFFGPDPWKMATKMILQIATTIVGVSYILSKGKYVGGPNEEWAKGIAISLGAFSSVYDMLADSKSLFGGPSPKEFSSAILTVVNGIVTAAELFDKAEAAFKGGPSEKWSRGVGLAIGAFAPVYKILEDFPITGGKKMKIAIKRISEGIVDAAGVFDKGKAKFAEGGYPSVKWGQGVGAALKAFAPVFKSLSEDTGWLTSGDDVITNMVNGVKRMARAIVSVAKIFMWSKVKWDSYPGEKWSYATKVAIKSYIGLAKFVEKSDVNYWKPITMARKMVSMAKVLYGGEKYFQMKIDPNFIKKLSKNIIDYTRLAEYLTKVQNKEKGMLNGIGDAFGFSNDPIMRIAGGMVILAKSYDKLATSFEKFGVALEKINMDKLKEIKSLQTDQLANDLSKIKSKPEKGVWSNIKSTFGFGDSPTVGDSKKDKSKIDVFDKGKYGKDGRTIPQQLDLLIRLLTSIDNSTNTIDEFIQDASSGKITNKPPELK